MKKRIILTGGGTAGHIWPLLSLYRRLKDEYEFLFIGSGDENERLLVERANIRYKKVLTGKLRRYFSWMNFIDPFKIFIGIFQSIFILISFRPSLVFAKGGFVSAPIGFASFLLRRKIFIHESDAVMGLANRSLAGFSKIIFTGFPKKYYPKRFQKKIIWSGVPVRDEVLTGDKGKALDDFGFTKDLPVLLVIGGSSGATGINNLVFKSLEDLTDFCQVIHLTGRKDFSKSQKIAAKLGMNLRNRYRSFSFVTTEQADIYSITDLAVSRSGATTLSELAALGKPTIFIPYPYSASDHQYINAKILEKKQAAVVLVENETTKDQFVAQIKRLVVNESARKFLAENIRKYYKKDSIDIIIDQIKKV